MTEQNENQNEQTQPEQQLQEKDDKASRFLSDALKASFTLLKIIMVVLLVLFLFSGLQTIVRRRMKTIASTASML